MLAFKGLQSLQGQVSTLQVERGAILTGSRLTRRNCSRQRTSTIARAGIRSISRLASQLGDTTANTLLSLSLAAVLVLQQPRPALADSSTSAPPPSTASSSSTASQAASRTVIDVVSGENTVLNEENAPDNRQGPDHQQKDNKSNKPVGDISEVGSGGYNC